MFDILKFLDEAPIKLTSGVGSPDTGGCWMAALTVYTGNTWSDHPDCVCPIIRQLCIKINDAISSDAKRGELLAGILLEPVGTETGDRAIIEQRRWHLTDAAVRRFTPYALRLAGLIHEAEKLESLPQVTEQNARAAAAFAADAARAAADAAAAAAADAAADAASFAADAAGCFYAGSYAGSYADSYADSARSAARAAACAPYAARDADARDEFIRDVAIPVVLELCQIGSKVPVEPSFEGRDMLNACQVRQYSEATQ